MWQGALRVAAALATLAWLASGAAGAGPNADQLSCILTRCAAQATACLGDAGCKATQDCFAACATDDLVCTNSCFFNTANKLFGELAMCSAGNGCTISAVVGNQSCPEFAQSPSAAAVDLPATLGEAGTWFVAGGANPVSDCLGCQAVLFEEQPDGALSGRGSSFTNGRRLDTNWTAAAPAGGTLDVNYTLFDTIPVEEHWRVVDISDDGDFILMLICGSLLGGAEYVNSQIFSTRANATLPANLTARFDAAIEEAGLGDVLPDISDYCSIDYSASCQYAPWVPGLGGASTPAASPGSAPAPAPAPAGPTSSAVLGPRLSAVGLTLLAAATAALL